MGSGRGHQRRIRAVAAIPAGNNVPPLQLVSAGEPVAYMEGIDPQPSLCADHNGVTYFISEQHPEPAALLTHFTENLARCPERLREPLKFVGFPYGTFDGVEPGEPGTCPISASRDQGLILVWGTKHPETGYRNLSQQNVEHELSHLVSNETGVPEGMDENWRGAQKSDAAHHLALPELPPFTQNVSIGDVTRKMNYGQEALTSYAVDNIKEDWAESVEYYLVDQRQGYLWRDGDQEIRFEDYYPARTKLIAEFLGT